MQIRIFKFLFTFMITASFLTLANYSRQEQGYTLAEIDAVNQLALGCDSDWVCELEAAHAYKASH